MSNKTKTIRFTLFMAAVALLPVVASVLPKDKTKMVMFYDDNKAMEREIVNKIPIGSNIQLAKQMMKRNGFKFTKQTSSFLEFEKEESYGPDHWGTFWTADVTLKNRVVSGAKVWIEPAD